MAAAAVASAMLPVTSLTRPLTTGSAVLPGWMAGLRQLQAQITPVVPVVVVPVLAMAVLVMTAAAAAAVLLATCEHRRVRLP